MLWADPAPSYRQDDIDEDGFCEGIIYIKSKENEYGDNSFYFITLIYYQLFIKVLEDQIL